ncbi:hypothetical protein [Natronobiforma cellulositropha]|uniref:hypothetical protein n=1 Tax=Natronobiforma cellulositropha TaxID=1679076 RepID=UPI0021D60756|nr:hypothetical protein [Natronobiforma cellulositropha]
MEPEDTERDEPPSVRSQLLNAPSLLRFAAFALVIGGFLGALETGASPIAGDSAFSLLFYAGIACAVGSIYLGIFQHDLNS